MGLFSKVIDQQKLTEAWNRVKRNKPAPGVDEMTWEDFDGNRKQNIRQLNIELSEHKYESLPVKLVPLYKGEKVREVSLYTMRDKVVQQSLASELVRMYDGLMSPSTYAYRPGRAALQAIDHLNSMIGKENFHWALKADIKSFFDYIMLPKLYQILGERIKESDVIELIRRCCEAPSLGKDGALTKKTRGVYQGSGIAPVLSNIYLMQFDHEVVQKCRCYVRYSDDILVLGETEQELVEIRNFMGVYLEKLGLTLHEDKTKIVPLTERVDFLGYTLGKDGKQIPAKAEENLSTSLEDVFFNRKTTLQEKLKKGSEILNGWEQYYKDQRPIGSIQEFVVVVYMMQNHVDGKLDFLRETRRKFTNVSQSICEYMAKFWNMHDRLDDALWEYEQFFELTGLDGEQKIADPERFLSYFEELIVREQEEIWTELMQEYSDAGAYNRAAAIMKKIERLKTRPAVPDLSGEAAGAEADAIRPGQMTGEWLAAYSALFVARDDVYGEEEILAGNKRQVVPKLEPLTDEVLKTHFSGKKTIASYVQRTNQTVKYLVIDVDVSKRLLLMGAEQEQIRKYLPRAAERAAEVLKILERMGLHGYVENSGYRGYHIWVFFTEWIPVRYVVMLEDVLEEKLEKTDDDISIEFFPNRSRIRNGSYGQSIKLPGGMHIKSGKRSGFCNEQFEPVEMSYEFLTGIAKYTLMAVKKILGTMSGTEKEPKKRELSLELEGFAELPPSVKVVLEKCNLVRYLCQKAQTTGYLSHFERLTILYVFGHLGEEGKTFVHTVMEFTLNYQYHVTEKFIQKLPAKPVSCVKLRDQYKQITAEYGCSCNFRRTKNCYPSPVLHALKNSSDVADDITIPTSRTLTKKVEEKVIEEINIHKKVQDLAVRIVEMKKQKRGVEKKIQKVENELETIYDQAGVDCLEVDMGMLVRRKKGQGYEWLIEI